MSFCFFCAEKVFRMEREKQMQAEGLILAGGRSTRMGGRYKGSLTYGGRTFTRILADELKKEVSCVRLSYGREKREDCEYCEIVMDDYPDCGPIGGIYSGLLACGCDLMLTAACDMPLLKVEFYRYLINKLKDEERNGAFYDGVIPAVRGRLHPLAAIYKKRVCQVIKEQILNENYCLRDALKRMHMLYVDVTEQAELEAMLQNINTVEEYERLTENE